MKRFSKVIAFLICLVMVVGLLPTGVFAAGGSSDIDFTKAADADKYEIIGKNSAAVEEGVGLALVTTRNAIETCNGQNSGAQATTPEDLVYIPVDGDFTATLEVEFSTNGASNGYYQFFGFFAAAGDDLPNADMAGIRGGDGAMQNFTRKNGTIDADNNNSTPGFASNGTYFLRLEKEGDTYRCYRSDNGEDFTQMFAYEGTGIESDAIVIDAYTGMTANYKFTLKYLELDTDESGLDKKAIRAAIRTAKAKDDRFFTAESFAVLTEALAAAEQVLAEAETQEALDEAAAALNAAIEGLVDNPDLPMMRVTFNYNYTGAPDPVVVEVKMGETVQPIETNRVGYAATWRRGNQNFNFNTPITEDITLTANWSKDWNQMYSLAKEYADYFPFGNFGTMSPGSGQTEVEYNTYSGNNGKMTYNFDQSASARDGVVRVSLNGQLTNSLNSIRSWNQQHPEGPKKWYRQHVLFWHGSEQNGAFYREGFQSNGALVSREVMNERIDQYVEAMFKACQQWDDVILSWDIVNEALDDYNGMVRNGWNGSWGESNLDDASNQASAWGTIYRMKDENGNPVTELSEERLMYESEWIRVAFASARKWQQELGVHWTLYYNDYMNSSMLYEPKLHNTLKVLKPIAEAGNIDGYGMQARLSYAYPTIDMLRAQIEEGVELCGEVSFSEADVRTDFEVNPLYDPNKETRRVRQGDEEYSQGGSGSYNQRSQQNGNTYDVSNGPVRRKNNFNANDPATMRAQADYWADLVDIMLEKAEEGKVGAIAIDGTSDGNTFNRGTGCQIWDSSNNEKPAFFALIGAPNRLKMRHAIEDGPAASEQSKYTAESWARYAAAKQAAEDLVEVRIYDGDGVEAVKAATAELLAATEALEEGSGPIETGALKLGPNVIKDPESPTGYTVKFLYDNATANSVTFNGDIMYRDDANRSDTTNYSPFDYKPGYMRAAGFNAPMEKKTLEVEIDGEVVEKEVWYYEVPMSAGANQYWFTVNGGSRMEPDPANPPYWSPNSSATKDAYNTVYVPYDPVQDYEPTKARTAELPRTDGKSGVWDYYPIEFGGRTHYMGIYTPYGYKPATKADGDKYKTIYMLHGMGQDESDWMGIGSVQKIMDNLLAEGKTEPAVIVSVTSNNNFLGSGGGMWGGGGANAYSNVSEYVIPYIEEHYNVSTDPMDRAWAGLSMGSSNTQGMINANAPLFGWYGCFSLGNSVTATNPDLAKTHILFGDGTSDFGALSEAQITAVQTICDNGGFARFERVTGGHDFNTWCQLFRIWCEKYLWTPSAFGDGEAPEVDYTALESAIAEADAIDTSLYTDESVAAFEEALAAAKSALESEKQTQVDAAEAALKAAIEGLEEKQVEPPVDRTALDAAIAAAGEIDKSKYTDETVAAVDAAVAAANALADDADQAAVDAAAAAINDAIAGLKEKEPVVPPVPVQGEWVLANIIEPGMPYVIVADGAYAMNNVATAAGGSYNDGGLSLGATAVTIEGDKITSEVDESMIWTINESVDVPEARDGAPTYFIFDQNGEQLVRRSGRSSTAPLSVGGYTSASPQYGMFSFYQRADGSYSVYTNSANSNDYNFTLFGRESGFDAPGVAQANWDGETYQSSIRLYTKIATAGLEDIDFTKLEDAEKYEIVGQTDSAPVEGTGLTLVSTMKAIETAGTHYEEGYDMLTGDDANTPVDIVKVPVAGDWTATLNFAFDQMSSRGYYEFFGFYAMEGEDYQNLAGIRGSDGDIQDFLRQDGAITAAVMSATIDGTGLPAASEHWFRIAKTGDTYVCSGSTDGENFTEFFTIAGTGVEADYLIIDAYSSMQEGYTYTLKSLKFEGGSTPVEPEKADKTALDAAIAAAEAVDKAKYTDESVAALEAAVAAAKAVQADDKATQDAVDAAKKAVDDAVAALVEKPDEPPVVDKGELDKAITAGELYDENDYTPESYAPLAEALEAAKAVQAKEDAAQDEVDAAAKAVNDAIAGLEKKPDALDKDALIKAISDAEALDPAEYTEESAKALADGIAAAKDALASAADQAAIDAAVEALKDVVDKLEKKPDVEPFRFDDVKDEGKFYFTPVYWAYEAEPQITNGKTANLFGPDDGCTRGQVVTFLWRAAGCPEPKSAETPFTDLKEGGFYVKAVAWAVENEITNGMSATTFAPDATCTRGQIVTFLWRFKGQVEPKSTQTAFTDVPATAFYAKAVAWAVENEVTNGMTPTTFVPGNTCTRGQVVTFLYRATAE